MKKNNCKAKDPKNCRFHGTGTFSTSTDSDKFARIAYLTTPEGIEELRSQGKHELAEKFAARRQRILEREEQEKRKNKQPIRLALDLDETSGGFLDGLRAHVAALRGLTAEEAAELLPPPSDYNLVKSGWFSDFDHFMTEFKEAERRGIYREMKPFNGMSRTLRTLVSNGEVEVHVVTAREAEWNEDTRYWLRKNRVPFSSITHTESKEEVEGMDVFIDDSDKQLRTLQEHGRTVIAYDNAYNNHVQTPHRVRSWEEIPTVIKLIAESRA